MAREGRRSLDLGVCVDPNVPSLQLVSYATRPIKVSGPHRRAKPILGVVGSLDHIRLVRPLHHREDGPLETR